MGVFMLFFTVSISGALYVNYLKSYLITPAQWNSAKWIEKNLPKNRVLLSYGHKTLLPFYTTSTLIKISPEVYCSKNVQDFQDIMKEKTVQNSIMKTYYEPFLKSIETTADNASMFYFDNTKTDNEKYANALSDNEIMMTQIANIRKNLKEKVRTTTVFPLSRVPVLFSPIPIEDVYEQTMSDLETSSKHSPLFIYYSKQDKRNPYRGRPYTMLTWGIDPCPDGKFLFDLYPDKFKRIYSINNEEVIIWKVL